MPGSRLLIACPVSRNSKNFRYITHILIHLCSLGLYDGKLSFSIFLLLARLFFGFVFNFSFSVLWVYRGPTEFGLANGHQLLFDEAAKKRDLVFVLRHGFCGFQRRRGGLGRAIPIQLPFLDDFFRLG